MAASGHRCPDRTTVRPLRLRSNHQSRGRRDRRLKSVRFMANLLLNSEFCLLFLLFIYVLNLRQSIPYLPT